MVLREEFTVERMTALRQIDGHNCGLMIMIYASLYINQLPIPEVSRNILETLRFRLLSRGWRHTTLTFVVARIGSKARQYCT